MFLIKIFHFLKGYVILSISGNNKEEFLKNLFEIGVRPANLKYDGDDILAEVSIADFFKLKRAKVKAKIRIERKLGFLFLVRELKKRIAFIVGMLAFVLLFALGSQFIWTVSFEGVENCDMNQLIKAAEIAGLYEGVPKSKLHSPLEMKNIILNNTDGVCWAWVYVKGTKAVVKIRENILPPEVYSPDVPCDIIAMRNGIIKKIITKHGRCVAYENQAVAAGDTIISGTYRFEGKPGYQVHSAGEVYAYTIHEKTGTYKQNYCYKKYTGNKQNFLTVKMFGWELPLYFKRDTKFECYDMTETDYDLKLGEDFYTGLGIRKVSYEEYVTETEPISYDTAVLIAERELEKDISRELLPGAELVNKDTTVNKIDEETISVTVTMNFIEKIGTEKLIEEVTFVEPKTDNFAAGG